MSEYRSKRMQEAVRRATQSANKRAIVRAALEARDLHAAKTQPFQPYRLTWALDAHDLYDPELSEALGAPFGLVDRWEEGLEDPTPEQAARLVKLTGHPLAWFYTPERPLEMGYVTHVGYPDPAVPLGRSRWKIKRDRPDAYRLLGVQP
jgi:DNA-binding transcriptional regulator YiaG